MPSDRKSRRIAQQRVVEALARHSSYLHRASTAQVNQMHEMINEMGASLSRDLLERLDNLTPAELQAFASGKYTTNRLKGLRKLINGWAAELGSRIDAVAAEGFRELAGHEVDYARRLLGQVLEDDLPKGVAGAAAYSAAMSQPVLGELVENMLSDIPERTRRQVYSRIRQGIAGGETNHQIIRALRGTKALQYRDGTLQWARNEVDNAVRTARNHISATAYDETYIALGVEYVVDVATLDGRTSSYCAAADGRRHKVGTSHPRPPYHYRCRTTQAPDFGSSIMGRRPYVRAFKPVGQIPKDDRPKGMVGQVSAGTTYSKWFERQPASFQREWLGPTRYRLYRDGSYSLDRFVDPIGGKLTIDQLRQRDAATFAELFG